LQILKDEIKEKIIRIATQEFLEKGFKLSSTRGIVKKVQISKGNLYNYFQSKEELFYEITTPFYHQFNYFLQHLCGHQGEENFALENVELLSKNIAEFVKDHRNEFIIIMDKSEGTKYAGYKEETISALYQHFAKNLKPEFKKGSDSKMSVMYIIAGNFLEALLAIARDYQKDTEAIYNIGLYLKYHLNGVAQFY
jgi:AcrR family transcriptional regulator